MQASMAKIFSTSPAQALTFTALSNTALQSSDRFLKRELVKRNMCARTLWGK